MSEALFNFLQELGNRTSGDLRTDEYSRILYSTDASIYQVKPHAVLLPQTVDDVQAAVELAAKHQVPLLPRTGGSSLAGQAVNQALVMDFTRHLDKVLEVNQEEMWVRAQPGIVLDALNIYLRKYGLQFGPDPASSNRAAMGGIVSNNSTGSHSIMYGMTADHVLEMELLLADGTLTRFGPLASAALLQHTQKSGLEGDIYRQLHALTLDPTNQETIRSGTPRHWRRCGGYNLDRLIPVANGRPTYHWPYDERFNLAKLVCGAEGGLGVITELKLNLVPLPRHTALAIVHFNSLPEALTAVPLMLEVGPSAVELLDNLGLTMCRDVPEYARLLSTFIQGTPNCVLITEFYGESEAELLSKIDNLERHLKGQLVNFTAVSRALTSQQQTDVWTVRKVGLGLMMSIKGDHKPIPFIEDAAVPVEHLSEYVTKVEQFCNDIGTDVAYYAHASAGCIHIRPLINTKTAKEVAKLPAITGFSVDLLRGYGGSFSSEHGDGRARSWLNEKFFGAELYRLYQQVKQIFDPQNILNPGTVVNAGPMTENLRYGEGYQVIPITPHLDFSGDQGFDRAVEMCNGAGICRKRTTGTMCPSFMATREEEHATRGRANALRAAMSGELPGSEFTSERMYEVMELCVSCKACKAECPSSVDMAKIKAEFLAQYHDAHGTPLRDKLFANITPLSRLGSGVMAPLANWTLGNGLIRKGLERTFGISAKRSLPKFAKQSFVDWFKKHTPLGEAQDAPPQRIVLFNDTFSTYNDPHIAIAATELLEAVGFEVILPGVTDCGRPSFSKGLVSKARNIAKTVLNHLAPLAEQGLPIIFLEPSDLSAITDDYESLLPNDGRVALVAAHCCSFEEFIAELAENGELKLNFTDEARHLVLHGHCHQKALIGTKPARRILTLPPNYTLEEIDSSCCGMAGSFGYEAEHYDISLKMAERRLLPAMRATTPETILVAPGVSCRQQIKHGTGRQVRHPAEVLRAAVR
ncbi:FAD-binding and (Fe-S)-binding domain-containing protein [Candidatus Leptofilum sp.]|uniref:FAD-binding and (Fe-S)-binding domain-containing protein n=1 Tax=Candidatus Leptofilum sp. TaxID=3241576 RepID=UPI003B5A1F8B